jgi:hypothetical protein
MHTAVVGAGAKGADVCSANLPVGPVYDIADWVSPSHTHYHDSEGDWMPT